MNRKIKILLILPSLSAGGAERVMSFIFNKLDRKKFSPILVITGSNQNISYEIDLENTIFLNRKRVLFALLPLFRLFKTNQPDLVFSSIWHLNTAMGFLSVFFPNTKFIGREVNVMSVLKNYPESTSKSYPAILTKFSFKQLDAVVCQSRDMLKDIKSSYPNIANKLVLINNPITDKFKIKPSKTESNQFFRLITVGSLEPRKGHMRILDAISLLNIPFRYTIVGRGSMQKQIIERSQELQLYDKIDIIPYSSNIPELLKESHVFIQGSFVEGFPNALLESCAIGTPVVAFNAPGGINEIVENNINGKIVNSELEFAQAIEEIVHSNEFQPNRVSESVVKKYNATFIIGEYEKLFLKLANYQNINSET